MKKTDAYRLRRIVEIGTLLRQTVEQREISLDSLENNYELQWMVSTPLYDIGEQVNCISEEITERYPDLPWRQIAGLRHRLVHDYEGTSWPVIANVLLVRLPEFVEQIKLILAEIDEQNA